MKNTDPIRQGDVLLVPVKKLPDGLKEVGRDRHGRLIVAEGEATGHAHCITDRFADLFVPQDLEEMSDRFLVVSETVGLTHDEHDTLTVPPGIYRLPAQRQYAPEAPVRVSD